MKNKINQDVIINEDKIKICVKNVYKNFKEKEVLKDVSLEMESGHIYGIVGHNGSGKTVLFKCICGFYKCTKGEITVNDKVMGRDIDMLNNAGVIIEEPGFIRKWSGYNNLKFLYNINNRTDKEYLYSIMRKVGLEPESKTHVEKYSLGMRQRLAIAQAIMEDSDILILDEPMNGLDKNGIKLMRSIFQEMKEQGKLIILASHNREDIDILCDEVYEMENGELVKER